MSVGLRQLEFIIWSSFPDFLNTCGLLVLVIFPCAAVGVQILKHKFGYFDDVLNFNTLPHAFLVLLQVATSAGNKCIMNQVYFNYVF